MMKKAGDGFDESSIFFENTTIWIDTISHHQSVFSTENISFMFDGLTGNGSDYQNTNLSDISAKTGFQDTVEKMNILCIPAIIVIGILGNTLSFFVFACTHLRYQSCSVYLAFLNIADIGFLLCLGIIWFEWLRVNLFHRPFICQCVIYLSYVCAFLSSWAVVTFTIERYIVVFYPLKKHVLCTPKRAKLIVAVTTLTAFLLYSFSVWMNGVESSGGKRRCMTLKQYSQILQSITAVDTLITFIVPSFLIIGLNIGIVIKICQFIYKTDDSTSFVTDESAHLNSSGRVTLRIHRCGMKKSQEDQYGKMVVPAGSSRSSSSNKCVGNGNVSTMLTPAAVCITTNTTNISSHKRHPKMPCMRHIYQIRTTRALVIVSSAYVLLNLPSHAFRVIACIMYLTNTTYTFSKNALLWQNILQLIYYMNFASNVFLYSASSQSFRSAMRRLWERWHHKIQNTYIKMRRPNLTNRSMEGDPRQLNHPMACLKEIRSREPECCRSKSVDDDHV